MQPEEEQAARAQHLQMARFRNGDVVGVHDRKDYETNGTPGGIRQANFARPRTREATDEEEGEPQPAFSWTTRPPTIVVST